MTRDVSRNIAEILFPEDVRGESAPAETPTAELKTVADFAGRWVGRMDHHLGSYRVELVVRPDHVVRARFNRKRAVIYDWPYKLIQSSDGKHELYDLESDPGEMENLFARKSDVADEMRDRFEHFKSGRVEMLEPGEKALAPTPEQIEELKALGYF